MGFFFPVFGLTVRNAEPHRRGRSPSGSFGIFTFCRMLDPLGKPEDEITAPKPRVSSGSSSKQKATLSKTSATSKHCAQSDRQHDAVMEGIKQLQDQQLASLSSIVLWYRLLKSLCNFSRELDPRKGKGVNSATRMLMSTRVMMPFLSQWISPRRMNSGSVWINRQTN